MDFYALFFLLGGVAVMLIGMSMMGSSMEKFAGSKMKKLLGKATTNRFAGVGVGTAVTCVIQSSTATTVMLVGFVNIGLMTFAQAANVIMGANIGTTVTAWLVSLAGIGDIDVGAIAALIGFVGIMITIFCKKQKVVNIGNILVGLGLIFVGLEFMSGNAKDLMFKDADTPQDWAATIFGGDHFPLLLLLIGIVITALVHSSSTITSLMVVLASIGVLSFENALFLALGSNIGTCVTALMSSAGANVNAKRTATFHLTFNTLGCLLFLAPIWIWKGDIASFFGGLFDDVGQQIALFHTAFNLITTALLLPFINYIVRFVNLIVKDKKGAEEDKQMLAYIDDRMLNTPSIAVANTKKELIRMAGFARENINYSVEMLVSEKFDNEQVIRENETCLNFLNKGVTRFLTELIKKDLPAADDDVVSTYFRVVSDLERVGDYAENIMEYSIRLQNEETKFSDVAKQELSGVLDKINVLFDKTMTAFAKVDVNALDEIFDIEESIDVTAVELENKHLERLQNNACTAELGSIYLQTVSNLERVGDHINNVAKSIQKYAKHS